MCNCIGRFALVWIAMPALPALDMPALAVPARAAGASHADAAADLGRVGIMPRAARLPTCSMHVVVAVPQQSTPPLPTQPHLPALSAAACDVFPFVPLHYTVSAAGPQRDALLPAQPHLHACSSVPFVCLPPCRRTATRRCSTICMLTPCPQLHHALPFRRRTATRRSSTACCASTLWRWRPSSTVSPPAKTAINL